MGGAYVFCGLKRAFVLCNAERVLDVRGAPRGPRCRSSAAPILALRLK